MGNGLAVQVREHAECSCGRSKIQGHRRRKMYFCDIEILNGFNLAVGKVEVSGSITYHGVKHAQIKRDGKTIWHESRFIREDMGITEFKI